MHPGGKISSRKVNIYTSFLLSRVSVPAVSYDANTMRCQHCWSYISQLQHFSKKKTQIHKSEQHAVCPFSALCWNIVPIKRQAFSHQLKKAHVVYSDRDKDVQIEAVVRFPEEEEEQETEDAGACQTPV